MPLSPGCQNYEAKSLSQIFFFLINITIKPPQDKEPHIEGALKGEERKKSTHVVRTITSENGNIFGEPLASISLLVWLE